MKILNNKYFYIILVIILIMTGLNIYNIYNEKNDDIYINQIEQLNNSNRIIENKINNLKKYKTKELSNVVEDYYKFVKKLRYLVRGSKEIKNFNINFKNNKSPLIDELVTFNDENSLLKELNFHLTFKLKDYKNYEKESFFDLYKPLIYVERLTRNNIIKIEDLKYKNNTYILSLKFIGK